MAKRKSTFRPRGELAGLAAQLDAYHEQHPDLSVAQALTQSGIKGLNLKAYRQWKYRQKKAGHEIPLDAIPERQKPWGEYKRKKVIVDSQTQMAIDLLKMVLKILEAR
jgi:hypothetical protein